MSGTNRSYGEALPDQVERIANFFDSQLEAIGDVRELYMSRVALEREYAAKLQALTRKTSEKKAKALSSLILGNDPTKSWDGETLKKSTFENAYEGIIKSMISTAQDHVTFADTLSSQMIEVLKNLEKRNEDAKKQEMAFFQKLLSDRDLKYADRLKNKQKYDEECSEVESFRQKQGRASDDRHAERVAKQAEQQKNDMLNSKNSYLISIAIANQTKGKFYQEDVPNFENELQTLQGRLVERFVKILTHGQSLQLAHLDLLKSRIVDVAGRLDQVDVAKDQDLFIAHNLRAFTAPDDWKFEPCSVHYDTDAMSVEQTPKVVIQNKLRRAREKIQDLNKVVESKRAEANQLSSQVAAYEADNSVGPIDDLTDNYLQAEHQLVFYSTSERILKTEIDVIVNAIGDDEGDSKPHSFKSSSFSIPTQCGYCKSSIWGLSKLGKTCKTCGLSVHAKCELKVPANCTNTELQKTTTLFRRSTDNASNHKADVQVIESTAPEITPSASSFVSSISSENFPEEVVNAKVLFDFTPTSEFELEVHEGDNVRVIEADDGSGWMKVVDEAGNSGLVPASYLETTSDEPEMRNDDPGETQICVRALYPYVKQDAGELSLQPGDILTLAPGGESYGNGWWEGFNQQGVKGIFPSNYVSGTKTPEFLQEILTLTLARSSR